MAEQKQDGISLAIPVVLPLLAEHSLNPIIRVSWQLHQRLRFAATGYSGGIPAILQKFSETYSEITPENLEEFLNAVMARQTKTGIYRGLAQ